MSGLIRPLEAADIPAARRILSLAFGKYFGVADPEKELSDVDYVGTRWRANSGGSFVVELDGELAGSIFASRWGSVGWLGPLTIRPDLWDRGLGSQLMAPVMQCFKSWGVTHAGLFTFADSARHLGLYQKFGFWPRFLTAIMTKPVQTVIQDSTLARFSGISVAEQPQILRACRRLSETLYPGLDLAAEIRTVFDHELGDTVFIRDDDDLLGFAVCHCGADTEAGTDKCYVKFGAVRPGDGVEREFARLLDACNALAVDCGMGQLMAGVNLARREAYAAMLDRGFRTSMQGVTMHRPAEAAYSRPGIFVMDDWR